MISQPNCSKRMCKHYLGIIQPDGLEQSECPACKAYPRGIPKEIAYGDNPHTKSFKGDHGILFGKAETRQDMALFHRKKR